MSRRATKKDLTKNQILAAAANLFTEHGYENTSIDDIAQQADVAKGTFYYHFDSKEALVLALRRESFVEAFDKANEALNKGSSPIRVLEQVFLERAAWTEKNPDLTKVFFEQRIHQFLFREDDAYVMPGIAQNLHKNIKMLPGKTSVEKTSQSGTHNKENGHKKNTGRFFQLVYELVAAGQEKKEIRQDIDPSELTQIIIATFLHAQGSWLGGFSGMSLIDKVHRWFHAILDGLYDQSFQADQSEQIGDTSSMH